MISMRDALLFPARQIRKSASELKSTHTLVFSAMLLAVQVVMNQLLGTYVTPSLYIGFGYLATSVVGALFGPAAAMLTNGLADIIGYLLKPTGPFFPGFTLSALLGGLVYGCAFYKRNITLTSVIVARLIVVVLINLCLNTLWTNMLYGKGFFADLFVRGIKNTAEFFVSVMLIEPLLKKARRLYDQITIGRAFDGSQ